MPKQSATNPRFRCNECKEFYHASDDDYKVHYHCPVHGYLCKEHISISKKKREAYAQELGIVPYNDKDEKQREMVINELARSETWDGECFNYDDGGGFCLKNVVKYIWHKDIGRWIEKGREEEEKAKAKPKAKSKSKPDYLKEINVLLDLLEDDTLTKEVFIKKIREKLK